ncbi:calphotin-like [Malaya genurostris]|uniref:calphotin-like n=1 Tax=Malaya genurostris TaxID=325434 RepID=UPI0026F3CB98|nr:calphotin-like [Malaya genurostris]
MKALLICVFACAALNGVLSASIIRVAREDTVPVPDEIVKDEPVAELRKDEIPVAVEKEPAKVIVEDAAVPAEIQRSAVNVVDVVEPVAVKQVLVDEPVVVVEKESSVESLRSVSPVVAVEEPAVVVKETEVVAEPVVEDKVVVPIELARNVEPVVEVAEPVVPVVEELKQENEPMEVVGAVRSALPVVDEEKEIPAVAVVESEKPVEVKEEAVVPAVRTVAEVILDKAEVSEGNAVVKDAEPATVELLKSVQPVAVVVEERKEQILDETARNIVPEPVRPLIEIVAEVKAAQTNDVAEPEPEVRSVVVEDKVVPESEVAPVESHRSAAPLVAVEEPIAVAVADKEVIAEKILEPVPELQNTVADEVPAPAVLNDEVPIPETPAAADAAPVEDEKVPVPEIPVEEKVIAPVESLRSALPVAEVEEPAVVVTEQKEAVPAVENEVVPAIKAIVEEKIVENEAAVEPTDALRSVPVVEEVAPVKEVEQEPSDVVRAIEVKDDTATTARPNIIQQIIQPVNNLIQNSPLGPILNRGSTTAAPGAAENLNTGEVAAANDEATTAAPNLIQQLGQNIQSFLSPNSQNAQTGDSSTTARPNIIQQVQNAVGSVFNRPSSNSEQQPAPATGPIQSLVQNVQNFFRPPGSSTAAPEGDGSAPVAVASLAAEDSPSTSAELTGNQTP